VQIHLNFTPSSPRAWLKRFTLESDDLLSKCAVESTGGATPGASCSLWTAHRWVLSLVTFPMESSRVYPLTIDQAFQLLHLRFIC